MKTTIYAVLLIVTCSVTGFAQTSPASSDTLIKRPERDTLIKREEVIQKVNEVKQDVNQAVDRAKVKVKEEYKETRSYQERNQLAWFETGSMLAGASIGVGTAAGNGTYLALSPRIGYFVQSGLLVGLRMGFDRRLNTSYHARQTGAFVRYYPFRTRYNSVNLEVGGMVRVRPNLGIELSLENNYYDQSDALAGRNKGGRFRFGLNYFFGRPNRQ